MTFENIIKTRVKLLREFDDFVINKIQDEEIQLYWKTIGVPDKPDDEILEHIAKTTWVLVCEEFGKCCKIAGYM